MYYMKSMKYINPETLVISMVMNFNCP